ncbi:hypothetical protein GQ44DRAFT_628196, partial [Phaeosphaeriaceae sp. PMI808]
EHPHTLTSMAHLALMFWSQRLWKKVEDVVVRVMETRKRIIGNEHPNTLTALVNLVFTLSPKAAMRRASH